MEGIMKLTQRIPLFKTEKEIDEQALKKEEILSNLKEVQKRKLALQSAFDLETDFELIDSYILELNALEKRYSHLFKLAKLYHITAV